MWTEKDVPTSVLTERALVWRPPHSLRSTSCFCSLALRMASSDQVRVAVIGAGPAGLVLARILQRDGFLVTVFEAEVSAHARPQGGSLDLHVSSGQRALREAGVYDEFLAKVQQGADASLLVDHTMKVYWADDGDGLRPEIERTDLRDLLLNSVAAGTVLWNRKLLQLQPPIDSTAGRVRDALYVTTCAHPQSRSSFSSRTTAPMRPT